MAFQTGPGNQLNPGTGPNPPAPPPATQPQVDTDPEVRSAQSVLNEAKGSYQQVVQRYNNAAAQYDYVFRTSPDDPDQITAVTRLLSDAATALAQAEENWAKANLQVANAFQSAASRAETPSQKADREAQARLYDAQASLARANANALSAKTPIDLKTSQAELERAQAEVARAGAEVSQLIPAQAANLTAQAQEAAARASTLIPVQAALTQAQAGLTGAQAAQAGAATAQQVAETTQLLPAQVRNTLAQAGYTEAQMQNIEQGLKRPIQITQGLDQRNLAFMNPQTGQVTGQENPAYQSAQAQLLQNQYDAIDQVRGLMERGQMSPAEAESYMGSLRAQTQAALRGATPFQEQQERARMDESRAGIGRDILNNRLAYGTNLATSLTSGLFNAAQNFTQPFDFSKIDPFALATGFVNQLGGGEQVGATSSALINALTGGLQAGPNDAVGQMAPDGLMNLPPGTSVQAAEPTTAGAGVGGTPSAIQDIFPYTSRYRPPTLGSRGPLYG